MNEPRIDPASRSPAPTDATTSMYTDGRYLRNNAGWHEEDAPWKARHVARILRNNSITPRSVCDIGCGSGLLLETLQREIANCEFDGYDIAPQAIEMAAQRENSRTRFHCASPFDSGREYDVALAIDVFEHVEDYRGFLRDIRRLFRYAVFHIPLDVTVSALLRPALLPSTRKSVGHLHYFTKDTALDALQSLGLEPVDWFLTAGALELPAKSLRRRVANVPRRWLSRLSEDFAARTIGGFSLMALTRGHD